MSPFITFRDTDKNNTLQYYILQREYPHYLAVISDHPVINKLGQSAVASHNLYIVHVGTLRGINLIPAQNKVWEEIQSVCDQMAEWFYIHRILPDQKKYKKWRIQNV